MHSAAKPDAVRCDGRCSTLQQPMQRVASSDAAKHNGFFTESNRLFRPNSRAVLPYLAGHFAISRKPLCHILQSALPYLANHFVVSCSPHCHISWAAFPYLIILFTTQPRDEEQRRLFSASDFHTPIIYIRCMPEAISNWQPPS